MISSVAFALLTSAALVAGHGRVTTVKINNVLFPGSQDNNSPVRGLPNDIGFVNYKNVNNPDIACSSGGYAPRKLTPEVPAGGQVGIRWGGDGGPDKKQWPHPEGPALAYLASCNGQCSKFDPRGAQFFKIAEEGLDGSQQPNQSGNDHLPWGQGLWAQNRIQYADSWNFVTIPKDIKPGEYLLRHELISLHAAHDSNQGAQYYPVCVQIKVTGGGNATPATTPATQLYTTRNGIVNIYAPGEKHGISSQEYKIPGPALHVVGQASVSGRAHQGHGQAKKRISH
ncbi:glycoside hydrolase family 61 protein [Rhizoctonia solani AG-3 Rhs1AP]|uniref:lytic cellulose monooxygenase (C4-dehydrogenating) n=2 Tax=Rhizoctonia solani AG-3 TaxID=1086053 RepID=A0A074S5T6_9AGAM|nr:glycoside hydrolase family 61 protein [Rhizoctonia solani AG-3 Rhs1AP]KEP45442.1 glycoside hydrolase family 61 protein [Rhizoctonia solani 123E]